MTRCGDIKRWLSDMILFLHLLRVSKPSAANKRVFSARSIASEVPVEEVLVPIGSCSNS
jgi:hypothetical protein